MTTSTGDDLLSRTFSTFDIIVKKVVSDIYAINILFKQFCSTVAKELVEHVCAYLCLTNFRKLQCESKKVAPLKLFVIFSLRLSIFP